MPPGSPESSAGGPEKAPHRLFISYRRGDSQDFVEHIRSWFAWRFSRVFLDFTSIPGGADWAATIRQEIEQCDAMLIIIGPDWMNRIRLEPYNDDDPVRTEIRLAVEAKKVLVPVCIKDTELPPPGDLPPSIRRLLENEAIYLKPGRTFIADIAREIESLSHLLSAKVPVQASIEKLDARSPAAGLALGYYVNFVKPLVLQLAAGTAVTLASGRALGPDELRAVRLQIVLPPRPALVNDDEVLNRLPGAIGDLASVMLPSGRPLRLPGAQHGDGWRLIDVPRTVGVLDSWVQRQMAKTASDSSAAASRRVEQRELSEFESVLRWWIDDQGEAFRERVEVLSFPADRAKLTWLAKVWPQLGAGDAAPSGSG